MAVYCILSTVDNNLETMNSMQTLTKREITLMSEITEAETRANYYLCAPANFAKKFKIQVKQIGSAWVTMVPGVDLESFNRVVGLGVQEPATERLLDDVITSLQKAGNKHYTVQLCPSAQPRQLADWLTARGFVRGSNWAKVYRDSRATPRIHTDLRIDAIGPDRANAFSEVIISVFKMPTELHPLMRGPVGKPGWRHYLAYDGDQPISAAAMYIKDGIGWLGFGGTLGTHRRRGAQGALMVRRIQDGIMQGCKWFVTEATEDTPEAPNPSYHNMLRAGFSLAYLRPNYIFREACIGDMSRGK